MNPDWIAPDWPAPANVRALMTTRAGGVSAGEYGSLNLGKSSGDDPQRVAQNREIVRAVVGRDIRWLHQVHGTRAVNASEVSNGEQADAAVARDNTIACAAMAADCLPVLFCATDGSVVASAHAGWRGLSAGVLESTISALKVPTAQLLAWLGPCIGPESFEVGEEVRDAFVHWDANASLAFVQRATLGKFDADLPLLARQRLQAVGVTKIYGGTWCTMRSPERFFSYRRVANSGRMAAIIWKTE